MADGQLGGARLTAAVGVAGSRPAGYRSAGRVDDGLEDGLVTGSDDHLPGLKLSAVSLADYPPGYRAIPEDEPWPWPEHDEDSIELTRELIAGLPASLTGLGLDRSRHDIEVAVADLSREELQVQLDRFCSGWPGEGDSACRCGAMDGLVHDDDDDSRRLDEHLEVEQAAYERVLVLWHKAHGPDDPVWINGTSGEARLERLAAFD